MIGSFKGKLRDGCPSMERFRPRAQAKAAIVNRRRLYNAVSPTQTWEDAPENLCGMIGTLLNQGPPSKTK